MRGCVSVSRPLVTCLACSDSGFLHYYYYFYFVLYLCIVQVGWVFLGAFSLLDFYCGNANVGRFLKPPQHPLTHTSTHLGLARILSLVVWVRVCVLFVRVAQHLHENDEWFYGLLDLNFIVCMHAPPPQPTAPHRPAHCEWKILCLHKKLDFCISYGNEKTSTWFVFHWFTRFARLLSLHSPPRIFFIFSVSVCAGQKKTVFGNSRKTVWISFIHFGFSLRILPCCWRPLVFGLCICSLGFCGPWKCKKHWDKE